MPAFIGVCTHPKCGDLARQHSFPPSWRAFSTLGTKSLSMALRVVSGLGDVGSEDHPMVGASLLIGNQFRDTRLARAVPISFERHSFGVRRKPSSAGPFSPDSPGSYASGIGHNPDGQEFSFILSRLFPVIAVHLIEERPVVLDRIIRGIEGLVGLILTAIALRELLWR